LAFVDQSEEKMNPYLSVVITGRNDDYGVNFMSRVESFVRGLDYHMRDDPDFLEIVMVEWNPLSDRARLRDLLPTASNLQLRVITVPAEIHAGFQTTAPVLEFPAKNVGVRRALGRYVLVTNPDIVFGPALISRLKQRDLEHGTFYRTDRFDFIGEGLQHCPPEDHGKFATAHTFQGHLSDDQCYWIRPGTPLDDFPKSSPDRLHTNGSGDFILAARETFDSVNGLFESTTQVHHCDSISVIRLNHHRVKQSIFTAPACIFHWDHPRGQRPSWNPAEALRLGSSLGQPDWGLAAHELEEWSNRS
jgi:hypothetical protein